MNSQEIIAAADEALKRASAPICYLHRTGEEGPFAIVIEIEHFHKFKENDRSVLEVMMSLLGDRLVSDAEARQWALEMCEDAIKEKP